MQSTSQIIDNLDQNIWEVIKNNLSRSERIRFAVWYLFLSWLKDIYKEFHNLSLNEVLELKSQLSRLSFQVKYCAKQLEQHFKIFIDLEKRAWNGCRDKNSTQRFWLYCN